MTTKNAAMIILALVAVFLGLLVAMGSCSGDITVEPEEDAARGEISTVNASVDYQYVRIDGMQCILFTGYQRFAATCDWRGRTVER